MSRYLPAAPRDRLLILMALLALTLIPAVASSAHAQPTITVTSAPPATTTSTTATIAWTTDGSAAHSWCSLDGAPADPCTSPKNYLNLTPGAHSVALSPWHKWELPSAEVKWTVLTSSPTAPVISFTQTPAASTTSTTATFAWSALNTTSVSCKLDGGTAATCTSPTSRSSLAAGTHTFVATATGPGGSASATYSWTVSTTTGVAPVIAFNQTPAVSTTSTTATFAWSVLNTTSVSCKLDSHTAAVCASPTSLSSLAAGTHTFVATASGNGGTASATYSWTIASSISGTGAVRYAIPSDALATIDQSAAGDTIVFQAGSYAKLVLDKSFSTNRVTIQCTSGVSIAGVDTNGQSGYTFDSCTVAIPQNSTDISVRAVENRGPSQDITWQNCTIRGGYVAWDVYGPSGSWAKNIVLVDSDVSGAGGDLIHTNGVDGLRIEHTAIHDPYHNTSLANPEHHDGWQAQNTSNAQFLRNIVYWISGPGAYSGQTTNYLGQGIMLSGESGAVSNVLIANNLIDHYNGRPVNMNGSTGVKIVNNTFQDSGDGISVTFGSSLSNVEVWNNIMQVAYTDTGSQPSYFEDNWLTGRADGYLGNVKGATYWTGDPGYVDRANYELTPTSPARGKGLQRIGTPTVDLDGNARTSPVLASRV